MFKKSIKLSLIVGVLLVNMSYAEDGFDDDDGFGDDEIVVEKVKNTEDTNFTYNGSLKYSSNYSYVDEDHLTSSKISADLNLEYQLNKTYKIKSTLKAYEDFKSTVSKKEDDKDFDINELYIQGALSSNIDIKAGRQIVVWGKSDNIRIVDTLNSMDLSTPAMTDIKDLRLGRAMSKLDYYINDWSLSTIILHENRYSTLPKFGSEYTTPNKTQYDKMQTEEPSDNLENSGIAFSLNGNLQGQDIAFYASNQYVDNKTYRSNMLGFAYNIVKNSFLLKTEMAYFDNYDSDTIKAKTDALAGVEYNGINDGSISFEVANKDKTIQYALRFTKSYLNDTLDFTTLFSGYGKNCEDGAFTRVWVNYAYDDDISLTFGVVDYISGDDPRFDLIKDNDRVFGSVKYSF